MCQDSLPEGISGGERDAVDGIVEQWRVERPDLDPSGKEITGRVVRLSARFQQAFDEAVAPFGIDGGEFGILSPLRRAGEPHALSPTRLAAHRMITSGGMTSALDRLERKGLVERRPNPDDRRSTLVALTEEGLAVIDRAMEAHAATEQRLVAGLAPHERRDLAALLRRLVLADEDG